MDYFKKCPKCGRNMTSYLECIFGQVFTIFSCSCGYAQGTDEVRYDNKTTYTGGGASDRTIIK